MKKLFKRIAAWLHKKKGANEIWLNSQINYLGHEFRIEGIDLSCIDGQIDMTIIAKERDDAR